VTEGKTDQQQGPGLCQQVGRSMVPIDCFVARATATAATTVVVRAQSRLLMSVRGLAARLADRTRCGSWKFAFDTTQCLVMETALGWCRRTELDVRVAPLGAGQARERPTLSETAGRPEQRLGRAPARPARAFSSPSNRSATT
jgi:hypothetical protein